MSTWRAPKFLLSWLTSITLAVLIPSTAFAKNALRILAYGDSLTAGYRLPPQEAYPAHLEELLRKDGIEASVTNGGVSGDTSAQALARLDWNLKQGPYDLALVGIGANDGLRLLPVTNFEKNLREIVKRLKAKGTRVLLLGMKLPHNFDAKYRAQFEKVYSRVAKNDKLPLLPFMLEGVAMQSNLSLEDQMHPNAEGQRIVARNVYNALKPLLHSAQ